MHVVHFEGIWLVGDGAIRLHARQHDGCANVVAVDMKKGFGYQRTQSRFHIEPLSKLTLGAYCLSTPLGTRGLRTVSANLASSEVPVITRSLAVRALDALDPPGGKKRCGTGHA